MQIVHAKTENARGAHAEFYFRPEMGSSSCMLLLVGF